MATKHAKTITASMFTDSPYDTATQKARAVKAFVAFVESGYDHDKWTTAAYNLCHQHMSMIAHYNKEGFYAACFADADGFARFLREFRDEVRARARFGADRYGDEAVLFVGPVSWQKKTNPHAGLLATLFEDNPFPRMVREVTVQGGGGLVGIIVDNPLGRVSPTSWLDREATVALIGELQRQVALLD